MKIKTISEFLLIDIDEPHRKQIVKNVIEQNMQHVITTEKVESRSQALLKAFIWNKSEEGFEHWHQLFIYFVEMASMLHLPGGRTHPPIIPAFLPGLKTHFRAVFRIQIRFIRIWI